NYTFENHFAACDTLSYISDVNGSASSDTVQTTLTVLKLAKDRQHPVVTIANHTFKFKLYSCNLIEKILADYPDNDFDKNHEYYITIRFNGNDLTDADVGVSVDNWVSNGSNHQLEP
ncbi:MAG: FimB/Mfa2 family fimbrial subunit, partial [Dysgonamonadaceae bacterium]|nr:FimB/Mfa2 family fimbrial subunit [Dysgonamonadaceae bacterium]